MKRIFPILVSALIVGCAHTPPVDETMSTPIASLHSYCHAVKLRNWSLAEKYLASDLRETLKDELRDRTFFDQYVGGIRRPQLINVINIDENDVGAALRFNSGNSHTRPIGYIMRTQVAGGRNFIIMGTFVKEIDGWKLTCPQIKNEGDFADWYDRAIHEKSKGIAANVESN